METVGTILEREGEALEVLLFKLVETGLLLEAGEARFLPRATHEVERARARARELDLVRATAAAQHGDGATLRQLALGAQGPWPGILLDHHDVLSRLVAEIQVVGHRNGQLAEAALVELSADRAGSLAGSVAVAVRPVRNAELDRLARGAALHTVLGTAARLMMPDLTDFLR